MLILCPNSVHSLSDIKCKILLYNYIETCGWNICSKVICLLDEVITNQEVFINYQLTYLMEVYNNLVTHS